MPTPFPPPPLSVGQSHTLEGSWGQLWQEEKGKTSVERLNLGLLWVHVPYLTLLTPAALTHVCSQATNSFPSATGGSFEHRGCGCSHNARSNTGLGPTDHSHPPGTSAQHTPSSIARVSWIFLLLLFEVVALFAMTVVQTSSGTIETVLYSSKV